MASRISDAEDAAAARQVADRRARLVVHAAVRNARAAARPVDHSQRRVARARQLGGGLDDALQERVERELGAQQNPEVDEHSESVGRARRRLHGAFSARSTRAALRSEQEEHEREHREARAHDRGATDATVVVRSASGSTSAASARWPQ